MLWRELEGWLCDDMEGAQDGGPVGVVVGGWRVLMVVAVVYSRPSQLSLGTRTGEE